MSKEESKITLIKIICPYFGRALLPVGWAESHCSVCPAKEECFRSFGEWLKGEMKKIGEANKREIERV